MYQPQTQVFEGWCHHQSQFCAVCDHYAQLSRGGRPKKTKSCGRPAAVSFRSAIKRIRNIAIPTLLPDGVERVEPSSPESSSLSELSCSLCKGLVNQAVELTSCRSLVCSDCLVEELESSQNLVCPVCKQDHLENFSTIQEASSLVVNVLRDLSVRCKFCSSQVKFSDYCAHIKSSCKQHTAAVVTLEDVLSRPLDSPLLPAEQQLQARQTRRSLVASPDDNVLRVKTGGQVTKLQMHCITNSLCNMTIQPMTFVQVRQPRLTSKYFLPPLL